MFQIFTEGVVKVITNTFIMIYIII